MELGEGVELGIVCNNVNNKERRCPLGHPGEQILGQRWSELSQVVSFLPFRGNKGGGITLPSVNYSHWKVFLVSACDLTSVAFSPWSSSFREGVENPVLWQVSCKQVRGGMGRSVER